jgi:hypothetical protein
MRRVVSSSLSLLLLVAAALALPTASRAAEPASPTGQRWLHVRVEKTGEDGESVRVNLPLKVAEKVLPAIRAGELRGGRLRIQHARLHDVDLRALLEAVRELEDGEFLIVQSDEQNVRVAKKEGHLLVNVDEGKGNAEKVNVKVPVPVVEALLSGEEDELNLLAAVQALREHGNNVLVTVESEKELVRIWVDSQSAME